MAVLEDRNGWVKSIAISPDGRWLATVGDRTVQVWDVAAQEPLAVVRTEGRLEACVWGNADELIVGVNAAYTRSSLSPSRTADQAEECHRITPGSLASAGRGSEPLQCRAL